jgi:hypothetical protein
MSDITNIRKKLKQQRAKPEIKKIYQQRLVEQEENDAYRKLHNLGPCENIEMHKMLHQINN